MFNKKSTAILLHPKGWSFLAKIYMKKRNYKEMSNSELKLQIESLRNIFESKKNMLKNICEEMGEVEKEYLSAAHELEIRKNILF